MVFVDDNPAERMQVRKELPEVAVPELPGDQALYGKTLLAAGYFEAVMFSDEDRKRADYYQGNAERAAIMSNSSDMASYLKSLEMEINFKPFDVIGRPRITQLINKSNQFNLTTKRYDENQVKSMESDTGLYTLQVRLKDIFGDNGMISVIICKISETNWEIDTWLMSCRVLGRSVEISVLQEIIKSAKKSGAKYLIGTYIPTERNIIVKEHYRNLGFKKTNSDGENETWQLSISEYQNIKLPIKSVDVI
jgi:FkbH-like protein